MTQDSGQKIAHAEGQAVPVSLIVPSHPRYLYVIRRTLHPLVCDAGFSRKDARRIILGVDEACANIIKHAYGGDPKGTIIMSVMDDAERFSVRLKDFGKKVDRTKIAPRALDDIRPGGLGTHFMQAAFDSITYDTEQGEGTVLTLEKKKQQVTQ
jgi:anti-sigma regulatory factor (Ser/Thr protein kinase)